MKSYKSMFCSGKSYSGTHLGKWLQFISLPLSLESRVYDTPPKAIKLNKNKGHEDRGRKSYYSSSISSNSLFI